MADLAAVGVVVIGPAADVGGFGESVTGFDAGEHPWAAARREAIEELGLAGFAPGGLLVVDQWPPVADVEPRTEYLFGGSVLDAPAISTIRLPAEATATGPVRAPCGSGTPRTRCRISRSRRSSGGCSTRGAAGFYCSMWLKGS
jgi:hypothetical protein